MKKRGVYLRTGQNRTVSCFPLVLRVASIMYPIRRKDKRNIKLFTWQKVLNYRWEESSSAFHCYVPSRFRAEYLNQALANREHQQGNWNTIQNNHRHHALLFCFVFFSFNKNSVFQVRMDYSYFFLPIGGWNILMTL